MNNIRYDLIPAQGITEVSKVLTHKLEKYDKNKWREGISWTEVLSSLKYHLTQFEQGIDYNSEGDLNIAEVASNAMLLCEYYKIYPQGDDRSCYMIDKPIIALDIDDVCLDFKGEFQKRFGKLNNYWNGSYEIGEQLHNIEEDKEFWTNLPALHLPSFEPDLYITSRSIPIEWTKENLQKMGFPCAPVYSVPWNVSKLDLLKEHKVNILIDDKPANYKEATNAGIFCYLMDAEHNRWFNIPEHRRIYNLNLNF